MDSITKNKLIEHINQNNLDQKEKEILIDLLNQNKTEEFIKHIFTILKLGVDIFKIFGMDDISPQ